MPKIYQISFIALLCLCQLSWAQSLHLKIEGASASESNKIDSIGYKRNFKNYVSLKAELDSIILTLERHGYYDREIKSFGMINDSIYSARINLNKPYEIIHIYYDELPEKELIKKLLVNSEEGFLRLRIAELESTLAYLVTKISEDGDPFYSLQLSGIEKIDNSTLKAKLNSITNKKRKIDKIVIKGYERFPKSFLKNYLRLRSNTNFNLDRIRSKSSNLANLKFANQKKGPEVLFTNDSTILYLYVEKMKSNNFDGFLGFGTSNETNKLQFNGYLNLNLLNNLNYGESLKLYYKGDENDQRTLDVKLGMPYLFGSPLGIEMGLNIFKRDSTFLTTSQNVALEYQLSSKSKTAIGYSSVKSNDLLNMDSQDLMDYSSSFITASINYTQPNSYETLFPTNFHFYLNTGFGKRSTEGFAVDQSQFLLETFKIFNLNIKNSIYGRVTGGYLISDNYLTNELFRFGGINSIRGFQENSLYANLYSVLNTEYRYKINQGLYIHSVFDAAYMENKISASKDKLLGFGFGFGLLTNSGLLKFNYSGSKINKEAVRISDFKIHISLTASF